MRISNTRISTKDKFYDNVSLLLKMDGANGSTTFTDSSPTPKTVTPSGNAQISTAQSKFGGSSALFDGSSYLTLPTIDALNYNSPFTIEGWVYPTNLSGNRGIFSQRTGGTYAPLCVMANSNTLRILVANASVTTWNSIDTSGNVFTLNTWAHVAVCGTGSQLLFFVNGVLVITASQPAWTTLYPLYIGADGDGNWFGHIDEVRFTKGVARYTSNFTTPDSVTPYRLSSTQNIDPFYDNVSLLLKMNGANGSTTFIDSSPNTKTITVNGGAQIRTDQWKFNGSSAYFNGPGNSLDVSASTDLALTGDFTVEWWQYLTAWPPIETYPIGWTPGQYISINPNGRLSVISTANINTPVSTIVLNSWQHIAIARSGTTTRVFVNGIQQASGTGLGNLGSGTAPVYISAFSTGASGANTFGHMDDIRITKGVARYTGNFTPLSEPFADAQIIDSLLLHFDGSNGSTNFVDSAYLNNSITSNGSAAINTAQSRFGGSSLLIDSTSKYLSIPDNNIFNVGGSDFTIECWVYATTWGSGSTIISKRTSTAVDSPLIIYLTSGTINARLTNTGATAYTITGSALSTSTWHHIAYTRSGNNTYLYVNGAQVGSTLAVTGSALVNTAALTIGNEASYAVSPTASTFYIDELRFTKGIARYTANFTPPTEPFPDRNVPYDLYSKYTSLLLHFDGSDNSTNFVDSSLNPKTITANGDVKIRVPVKKYGSGSAYFDGNGGYLSAANSTDLNLVGTDFTIEAWIYYTQLNTGNMQIINKDGNASFYPSYSMSISSTGKLNALVANSGGTSVINLLTSNATVAANTWNHVVFTRSGSTLRIFINGILDQTAEQSITMVDSSRTIGIGWQTGYVNGDKFYGYIDDLRVTKGIARYTSNFIPPTKALLDPYDIYYSNVSLLLPMNGTNGGTNFVDKSLYTNTITPNGWTLTTSNFKFGGASAQSPISPTSSNGIQITPTADLQMGASDFTFEAWVNVRTVGNPAFWYFNVFTGTTNDEISAYVVDATRITWAVGSYSAGSVSYSFPANTWTHVALTRSGSSIRFFINGSQVGTTGTYSGTLPTQDRMWLGRIDRYGATAQPMDGFIDDFRITKGVARYTANFTPPTQEFTNLLPISSDPNYYNNSLLMHFNGTNGSTTFTDSSYRTKTITRVGNAQISTAQSKFGSSSVYFDGSSALSFSGLTSLNQFTASGQIGTIECWIFFTNFNSPRSFLFGSFGAGEQGWTVDLTSSGNGVAFARDTTLNATLTIPQLSINVWYHFAVVNTGANLVLYINGENVGTTANYSVISATQDFRIGARRTTELALNGYIDELRVTEGVARYTGDFIPSTESFYPPSDLYYSNVGLLLPMNGTNGSTTFTDRSPTPKTVTANGNVQISTSQSKFGGSSALFDGDIDFLTVSTASTYDWLTASLESWTIECWINVPTVTGTKNILSKGTNNTAQAAVLCNVSSNSVAVSFYKSSVFGGVGSTSSNTLTANTWNHYAAVYNAVDRSLRVFLNGVMGSVVTLEAASNYSVANGAVLKIGEYSTGEFDYSSYIDDFRITQGVARYTANFTPPTIPASIG